MKTITYCTGWNRIFREPAEVLSSEKAGQLHKERKPYTVIVEDEGRLAVVEMCFFQLYCHVLFLDENRRVTNRFSFVETTDGRLFLEEVALHYYTVGGDRPTHGELFRFKDDGTLSHDTGKVGGPITRKEGRTDVSRNYASVPEFGNYDPVLVRER